LPEGRVANALKTIKRPNGATLANGIVDLFKRAPEREWRAHIDTIVAKLIKGI
jgi:hypothetical protein